MSVPVPVPNAPQPAAAAPPELPEPILMAEPLTPSAPARRPPPEPIPQALPARRPSTGTGPVWNPRWRSAPDEPDTPPLDALACEPLPDDFTPQELDEVGHPLATLHAKMTQSVMTIIVGALVLLLGFAILVGGLYWGLSVPSQNAWQVFTCTGIFGLVVLGIGGAVLVPAAVKMLRRSGWVLWICRKGLVWERGGVTTIQLWHEVRGLRAQATRVSHQVRAVPFEKTVDVSWEYEFELKPQEGVPVKFSSWDHGWQIKAAGDHIQNETGAALLPIAYRAFENGETVHFSPFHLDRRGMTFFDDFATWSELEEVELARGKVVVRWHGGRVFAERKLSLIADGLVLWTLATYLVNVRTGRSQGSWTWER
jgi:hypothetical protein